MARLILAYNPFKHYSRHYMSPYIHPLKWMVLRQPVINKIIRLTCCIFTVFRAVFIELVAIKAFINFKNKVTITSALVFLKLIVLLIDNKSPNEICLDMLII